MKLLVFNAALVSLVVVASVDCRTRTRSDRSSKEPQLSIRAEHSDDYRIYPGKIIDSSCVKLEWYRSKNPEGCLVECRRNTKCNAFHYKINHGGCALNACPFPIPEPSQKDKQYDAYILDKGPTCNPVCQNGATCNEANKCDCQPGWTGDACNIACGRVNQETRIIGNITAEMHEYPWQVGLHRGNSPTIFCGGILISAGWVLTAAHCTDGRGSGLIKVTLGSHLQNETEIAEKTSNIKTIIDHPQYSNWGILVQYDFSLLELETPLNLAEVGPQIAPVCLPSGNNPSQYNDVLAIVTGWGTTSLGGQLSNILLEATVMTMNNTKCNEDYLEHGPFKAEGLISESMICALEEGEGPCHGDSGGPLVTDVDGYFNLIGVVSWSHGNCHSPLIPVVYGRVTSAIDWITSSINKPSCT